MLRLWLGGMVTVAAAAAGAQPGGPEQAEHAWMQLVSEHAAIIPGETTSIGIELDIEQGWHLYWPGRNDTGMAPRFEWNLPPGYEVGPIQWPAPERYISPGDILDHVYEDRVLLIVPLKAPPDAGPESQVRLAAKASWVICDADVCLFGGDEASITLPVGSPAAAPARTKHAKQFAETRRRVPRPLPEDGSAGVSHHWHGLTLHLQVPGARALAFYPAEDCVAPVNAIKDGEAAGPGLRIRFDPEGLGGDRVRGVLEIRKSGETHPEYYRLDLPVEGN